MTAPATEKAAPIPAEVLALAERLRSMGQDIRSWGPAYRDRARADMLRAAALLADRASQEERIREDERDRLLELFRNDPHVNAYSVGLLAIEGAMFPAERARLRGAAS